VLLKIIQIVLGYETMNLGTPPPNIILVPVKATSESRSAFGRGWETTSTLEGCHGHC
jgi:hypothetical protein